jgi:ribosomal protein S18 acetylase RimI-like enzyme
MDSSTWDGMVLRIGNDGDAPAAAALHAGQISEGFLTFLGPRFLRRLYRRVARTPGCFLLVIEDDGTTVGFLAGSTDVSDLYRSFVLHDGIATALASGGRLLRSWRRVIETLRHGTGGAGAGAELLAVAVDPTARGRGAGTLLVEGFLTEVARRGQRAAQVVVAADNETAVALYRRSGFRMVESFELHSGTRSLVMQWTSRPDTES